MQHSITVKQFLSTLQSKCLRYYYAILWGEVYLYQQHMYDMNAFMNTEYYAAQSFTVSITIYPKSHLSGRNCLLWQSYMSGLIVSK